MNKSNYIIYYTKTVHHSENSVFLRRKQCFPAEKTALPCMVTHAHHAQPLPSLWGGAGGGAGWAGWAGPCCHLPPCCHHRYMSEPQRFRKAGGRVAANSVKKFFRAVRLTADKNSVKTPMVVLLRLTKLAKLFQNSQK